MSRERIRRIQLHLGVSVDGVIGPQTLSAIEAAVGVHSFQPSAPFREYFAQVAEREIGVREERSNMGDRVNQYKAATWLDHNKPWPWCAAFVCWCLKEAAGKYKVKFHLPETAGAWDFEVSWARGKYGAVPGIDVIDDPKQAVRGDIVVFEFSHIGIALDDYDSGYVRTVEGNTNKAGSREGDGVWAKTRKASQIRSIIRINN